MTARAFHDGQARADGGVNASKPLQTEFRLLVSCPKPMPADRALVLQMQDEAQAVRVSIGNAKQVWIARTLQMSAGMLSLIAHGHRRMPAGKLDAFCALTGTSLLKQYRELQDALARIADESTARERQWAATLPRSEWAA